MIKPVLIPTDKSNSSMVIEICKKQLSDLNIGQLAYAPRLMHSKEYFDCCDIILVDTEAKLVEGDWCYHLNSKEIITYPCGGFPKNHSYKVIASTNKLTIRDYKFKDGNPTKGFIGFNKSLPQLSPQSIQLLINYYNEFKCMPESIDIEEEYIEDTSKEYIEGKGQPALKVITLNQQGEIEITIPEVEEKLYTKKDLREVLNLGMDTRQKQLQGYCNKSGNEVLEEWFNQIKKK